MRKDSQQISIVEAPLNIPKEQIFDCSIRDRTLINHICKFRKVLENQGIEIFSRHNNILATSNGYYSAMYNDDIRNKEGGIDNPIPFKGKDGRMKVNVIKEDRTQSTEDLATLVAMAYCPNPRKHKHTWFYDCDPSNCNAENIYWCNWFTQWFCKTFKIKVKNKLHKEIIL